MRLNGLLVPAAAVTRAQRGEMFALMDRHYENVTPAGFAADLAEKRWVILLLDPQTEAVCGFSTQMTLDVRVEGRPVTALFSGDTIVDRDRWGDGALARVWGCLALTLIDAAGGGELYWFLLSKGYKTYRFLPVFFHEFYPRHDAPTPPWAAAVIGALGRHKYPGRYDPANGVVRGGPGQDRLRSGIADVTSARLADPDVRHFAARNPGHAQGDELCCVAPLTRANFTPAAYRAIGPEPVAAGVGVSG
jgi:hypothetical protein